MQSTSGGVTVGADDVNIGGDVAGRDVVKSTTVGDDYIAGNVTNVTNVGLATKAVQRLIITVGVLVFVTAACFFAGGVVIGANVFGALNRSVEFHAGRSGLVSSRRWMRSRRLPPGDTYNCASPNRNLVRMCAWSWVRSIGLENARVRVLDNGQYVVYGRYADLGGLPVMMIVEPQTNSDQIVQDRSGCGARDTRDRRSRSRHGLVRWVWLPVPSALVQPLVDRRWLELTRGIKLSISQCRRVPDRPVAPARRQGC